MRNRAATGAVGFDHLDAASWLPLFASGKALIAEEVAGLAAKR
jgi:hypothetical protein